MDNIIYMALTASKRFHDFKNREKYHRYLKKRAFGTTEVFEGQIMCLFKDQSILFDNGHSIQTLPPGSTPDEFEYKILEMDFPLFKPRIRFSD